MDSFYHTLAIGRVAERLFVLIIAGCALHYAFLLFQMKLRNDQTAEFKGGGFVLKLVRVGPGAIFLVLGIAALVNAVSSPLVIGVADLAKLPNQASGPTPAQPEVVRYATDPKVQLLRVQIVNTALALAKTTDDGNRAALLADLAKSKEDIQSTRNGMVAEAIGTSRQMRHERSRAAGVINGLPPAERAEYEADEKWYQGLE